MFLFFSTSSLWHDLFWLPLLYQQHLAAPGSSGGDGWGGYSCNLHAACLGSSHSMYIEEEVALAGVFTATCMPGVSVV
jgi:hypothetical protein